MRKTKKAKAPALPVDLARAVILAKALKSIDDAYYEMDAVFFNPRSYSELHDEIRDKIVELLAGVES